MEGHVLLYLLLDVVIVILAARGCGYLAKRLGQPAVIGEITAGILLGPTVLGRLFPDLPGILFPEKVPLEPIADLGLVFFMFLVGLELDVGLMRKEIRKSMLISISGIVLPFVLGMVLAIYLVPINNAGTFQKGVTQPPATLSLALFLGAAMCITAFPVLARVLVETGMYKTPMGLSALCAAAVDDAIAWILLAAVIGLAKTGSATKAVPALLLTLLFVGFMFTVGRRLLELLARRYDATGHLSVDMVALVLAGVLFSAYLTDLIGIHAIFGAFIFGVVMPKRSTMIRALTDKIEDFNVIVFLPIFFAVVGLRTNLLTLNNPELIGWTVLILVVATIGKAAGTGLAAYFTGSSARESVVVGTLMNTRGLTELVILSIGLSLGVLSDRTFAMMVIMALGTTVMAAPIVNRLISRKDQMRALIGQGTAASGETPPVRILVAIGNPLTAPALVQTAIMLTGDRRPAELLLVKLIPSPRAPEFSTGLLELDAQVAASVREMEPLVEQAEAAGVAARPVSFPSDNVGLDLARIAADQKCELILLGWLRALLSIHLLRALVHRVFATAPCHAAVLMDARGRGIPTADDRAVLAVLGGDTHDEAAWTIAARVAKKLHAPLRLVGYLHEPKNVPPLADLAQQVEGQGSPRPELTSLKEPSPRTFAEITAQAAAGVIVVGDDWLMAQNFGRPTDELVSSAQCPLLILRAANWLGGSASLTPSSSGTHHEH